MPLIIRFIDPDGMMTWDYFGGGSKSTKTYSYTVTDTINDASGSVTNFYNKIRTADFREWLMVLGYAQNSIYNLPHHVREFLYFLEQQAVRW